MISNSRGTLFNGDESPFTVNQMMETLNAYRYLWGRGGTKRGGFETRFDVYKECDLPQTEAIEVADYKTMYDRNPIAGRVVEVMPEDCWATPPEIYETENPEEETAFEKAVQDLAKSLRGEESWYAGQEGNPLWSYCHRADILAGIGHFGLMLIGIDDGKELHEPIDGFEDEKFAGKHVFVSNLAKARTAHRLTFLSVFDESAVLEGSVQYEMDKNSIRYRKPKMYQLTLGVGDAETPTRDSPTLKIHWSRIIHIPSQLLSSDVLGVPLQRPVWDQLLGLRRIYAVDPVAVWKNIARRTWLETHPQLGGDVTVDEASLRAMMWDLDNTQQKNAILKGMTAKTDGPQLADPKPHIDSQIEAICIKLNIPRRKFVGSAPGQLGGAGDAEDSDDSWNDQVRGKRTKRCIPHIVVPLIDRLIQIGVLPIPAKGYYVAWEDPSEMSPMERADLAVKRTDAMSKYVAGGLQVLIDPMDFLTRELGYEEEEAEEILERAEIAAEKIKEEQAVEQEEQQAKELELAEASAPEPAPAANPVPNKKPKAKLVEGGE